MRVGQHGHLGLAVTQNAVLVLTNGQGNVCSVKLGILDVLEIPFKFKNVTVG